LKIQIANRSDQIIAALTSDSPKLYMALNEAGQMVVRFLQELSKWVSADSMINN
jgi:hypothetical protein